MCICVNAETYKNMPSTESQIVLNSRNNLKNIGLEFQKVDDNDVTYVYDDNVAYVQNDATVISVDNFKANSKETVNLHVDSSNFIHSICFNFPVDNSLIKIDTIKISVPLWFDTDLMKFINRSGNNICFDSISIQSNDIYFVPEYLGEATIKYSITMGDTVLDPYIVGDLNVSNQLVLSIPFVNSIQPIWSAKANSLNASSTRSLNYAQVNSSYSGSCTSAGAFADGSWATSTGVNVGYNSVASCDNFFDVPKNATDSGMTWDIKTQGGERNVTIPDTCFNQYTGKISLWVDLYESYQYNGCNGNYIYDNAPTTLYCFGASGWQQIYQENIAIGSGCSPTTHLQAVNYESLFYLTNQSGYIAYNYSLPQSKLINAQNLYDGYLFDFNNNSKDISGNNFDGLNTSITYNSNGANFNGVSSYINTTVLNSTFSNDFTICLTANLNSNNTNTDIMGDYDASPVKGILLISESGHLNFYNGYSSLYNGYLTTNSNHFICIGQNSSAKYSYVDGNYNSTSPSSMNNGLKYFYIGTSFASNKFNGSISQFFLYNRSLSLSEIQELYAQYNSASNKLNESNSAMNFTGKTYVAVQNTSLPVGNSSRTVCEWFKTGQGGTLFNYGEASALQSYGMYFTNNDLYADPYGVSILAKANLTDSQWHHACLVYNGTTLKTYVDSVLTNSSNQNLNTQSKNLTIGKYDFTYPYLFNGTISQFMAFNYELSPTDIFILANGYSPLNWINVTDCNGDTSNNFMLYNVYDEDNETATPANQTFIEAYVQMVSLADPTRQYNFSILKNSNQLSLCVPKQVFNVSNFVFNSTVKYYGINYAVRYSYLYNQILNSSSNISKDLYDLSLSKTTEFLLTYVDQNNIPVPNALVDVLKQYISHNNQNISVENALTDDNGQAVLHLEASDIIYMFNVWQGNTLLFSSSSGRAICQASPCVINLKNPFISPSNATLQNLAYTLANQSYVSNTSHVLFTFSTVDMASHTVNLTVYNTNYLLNDTACSLQSTTASGSLDCTIPPQYANTTLYAKILYDGGLFGVRTYTLNPTPDQTAGDSGVFMTIMLFLTMAGMAISSPMLAIVVGTLALIFATLMQIFNGGTIYGIGSTIIFLICGSAMIIWKLKNRRNG